MAGCVLTPSPPVSIRINLLLLLRLLQEKWLEHEVIRNSMRATSMRIDLLMRVVEEACKRRVTAKRAVDEEEARAQETGGLIETEQAEQDREKDKSVLDKKKEGVLVLVVCSSCLLRVASLHLSLCARAPALRARATQMVTYTHSHSHSRIGTNMYTRVQEQMRVHAHIKYAPYVQISCSKNITSEIWGRTRQRAAQQQ